MPGFQDFVLPFGANTNIAYSTQAAPAFANMFGAFPQAISNLYNSGSQAFTGYGQGLSGISQAQAGNYGSYAGALGNLGTSYGNQLAARYGANAMAEAARQGAVSNIGSSALGAYGNLGGQAMQAWAQNQSAYNKAMSDMVGANQYATSQLGQSRNAALAGLGGSYAQAAAGLAPATLAKDIALNFSDGGGGYGGGGFSATGADGQIGSGSYGGGYGAGGGMNFTGSLHTTPGNVQGIADQTYGGLGNVLASLNDDKYSGKMDSNYQDALGKLNSQHMSSREMPSQMMGQGLQGLRQLGSDAYAQSGHGMDQFYGNMAQSYDPSIYRSLAQQLGSGYRDSSNRVSQNATSLGNAWNDNKSQFTTSLGALNDLYAKMTAPPPAPQKSERQMQQEAADQYRADMISKSYMDAYKTPNAALAAKYYK